MRTAWTQSSRCESSHCLQTMWQRSTRCESGHCLEARWSKSTRCESTACVEARYRRSSKCDYSNCVEVATPGHVLVRDSKDVDGGVLEFGPAAWSRFLGALKAGDI